jgi:two-component sensor histidine kinase
MSSAYDRLLRETHHRCSNDLQLILGLLALQSRRAASSETREALSDAMERVAALARARATLNGQSPSIEGALRQVCEALHSQAEPRGISVSLDVHQSPHGLAASTIMTVALAVNELATNAIKHAFEEERPGYVRVSLHQDAARRITIFVDDDGLPFPEIAPGSGGGTGLGLGLVKRLIASAGGLIIVPTDGSKIFELRIPADVS